MKKRKIKNEEREEKGKRKILVVVVATTGMRAGSALWTESSLCRGREYPERDAVYSWAGLGSLWALEQPYSRQSCAIIEMAAAMGQSWRHPIQPFAADQFHWRLYIENHARVPEASLAGRQEPRQSTLHRVRSAEYIVASCLAIPITF